MTKIKDPKNVRELIARLLKEEVYISCSCGDDVTTCMCDTGPAIKTDSIENIMGPYRSYALVKVKD